MKQKIIITYDIIKLEVEVVENDFTNFEALGVLESVKQMIAHDWLNKEDNS